MIRTALAAAAVVCTAVGTLGLKPLGFQESMRLNRAIVDVEAYCSYPCSKVDQTTGKTLTHLRCFLKCSRCLLDNPAFTALETTCSTHVDLNSIMKCSTDNRGTDFDSCRVDYSKDAQDDDFMETNAFWSQQQTTEVELVAVGASCFGGDLCTIHECKSSCVQCKIGKYMDGVRQCWDDTTGKPKGRDCFTSRQTRPVGYMAPCEGWAKSGEGLSSQLLLG